jgi:hypothetical protein
MQGPLRVAADQGDARMSPRRFISDPAAWIGSQIQREASWIHRLQHADVAELEDALARVRRAGIGIPFPPEAFPLPGLAPKLDRMLEEIERGRGFVLVRGIPRERYSDEECELIYWGIAVHLGRPVSQNARGHLLGHVRDEGRSHADPEARGYQTRERMDFHTDLLPVDVLGLFCLRTAKSGGASKLVSALTVHNVLREERPDLLEALYAPFHVDWRGEEPEGERPWFTLPMFSEHDGLVTTRIVSLPYYLSAARHDESLRPSALQIEALEKVQEIANRPELMLSMDFQEGDIQLINNHVLLHAREAYEDHPEPHRKRHLLRIWIAVDDARRRPLAPALAARYDWVRRGGIPRKGEASPVPT